MGCPATPPGLGGLRGGVGAPHQCSLGGGSLPPFLYADACSVDAVIVSQAQTVLALFAITSSPLILGNDPRPGMMQQRLIDLLLNEDMLAVDQQYSEAAAFAGGRIWSGPSQQELWAKPLTAPAGSAAVVLFNRAGVAIGGVPEGGRPLPPHCNDKNSSLGACVGCFNQQNKQAPCDDNVTASSGSQTVELQFAQIDPAWLGLGVGSGGGGGGGGGDGDGGGNLTNSAAVAAPGHGGGGGGGTVSCTVFDIFATARKGKSLGRFTHSFSAMVPPHGSRFIRLEDCKKE